MSVGRFNTLRVALPLGSRAQQRVPQPTLSWALCHTARGRESFLTQSGEELIDNPHVTERRE